MLDFHTLQINNFRSYKGWHVFTFPTEPGLYFITGNNKVNEKLGANGTGKSTLLDAIFWCFYGKTLRGLRGSDVLPWGLTGGCSVELMVTIRDVDYTILRTQAPNKLTINGEIADQERLDSILGITAEAFTYAVIMPQFGASFFELSPANKLALFSQLLNLDFWVEKSQAAADKTADYAAALTAKEAAHKAGEGALERAIKDLFALKRSEMTFEANRLAQQGVLDERIAAIVEERNAIVEDREDAELKTQKFTVTISGLRDKVYRIDEKLDTYNKSIERLRINSAITSTEISNHRRAIEHLKGLRGTCPTCLQEVDSNHIGTEKMRLLAEIAKLDKKLGANEAEIRSLSKFKESLTAEIRHCDDLLRVAVDQRAENSAAISKDTVAISRLNGTIEELNKQKAEQQSNPFGPMLAERQREIGKLRENNQKLSAEVEKLRVDHETMKFWVQGFKRVRLFIVEETLRTLEVEINSSLAALGLTDWQITLDVERENKSGGITKGFTVNVMAPDSPESVRFEAWSGGEAQRLQLAGDLGLANLIMLQTGLQGQFEFYDEPSEHLSHEGLLDLAETLQHRALTLGKRIFMIDHHTLEFGGFAGTFLVTKTAKGSSISAT